MIKVYARKEATVDNIAKKYCNPSELKPLKDVVIYKERNTKDPFCRFMWDSSSKPDRRNKTCMINCFRYNIVWLEDIK